MGAKRAPNVIDEHRVHLLWLGERKQQQAAETLRDRVLMGTSALNIQSVKALPA
jgi:hypothetical protein